MEIQNQLNQWFEKVLLAIKKLFQQKKIEKTVSFYPLMCIFWIFYMDRIKYWVSLKILPLWRGAFVGSFLKQWTNLTNIGCPKYAKLHYFGAKMEIYFYDQNIGSPEIFCLFDVVDLSSFLSKMDKQS